MVSPLLEPFREAYRNLELLPLRSDKELQRFAVKYGTEIITFLRLFSLFQSLLAIDRIVILLSIIYCFCQ